MIQLTFRSLNTAANGNVSSTEDIYIRINYPDSQKTYHHELAITSFNLKTK